MKDIFNSFLGILAWLYAIMSQIMTVIFFVQYCKIDPLWEILLIDPILSEIKGILWIVFIWF